MHALRNAAALAACLVLAPVLAVGARQTAFDDPPTETDSRAARKPRPALYGDGVLTTPAYDFFVSFTPDGKTVYFCRATGQFSHFTILRAQSSDGGWGTPEVVEFSGRWSDADPRVSPDGKRLFFISNRPTVGFAPRPDYDMWVADGTPRGWSEPKHLGARVNGESPEWSPTVTLDGTLYFGTTRRGGLGGDDLWTSKLENGEYGEPKNLGDAINTRASEIDPFVAPDGSYLVFGAAGRPDGFGGIDLYVSHRRDGAWTRARPLPAGVNSSATDFCPTVSADGRTLFFTSTRGAFDDVPDRPRTYAELERQLASPGNGLGDIYRIDASVLELPIR